MLAGIPVFPRKRRCCTRVAIHLRLRRDPGESRAILKIQAATGEGEDGEVRSMPQENGWLLVEELMEIWLVSK